jgi:hypothetical protein
MCDYSLHSIPNRLAVEGEPLLVHRFPSGSLGLASQADRQPPQEEAPVHPVAGWWERIRSWLSPHAEQTVPAVCVPPGAQLVLRDIPRRLQQTLGVGAEEGVTFVQLSAEAYGYRDAVRFRNGRAVLLQRLEVGQRVDVLCLASGEAEAQQVLPTAASR